MTIVAKDIMTKEVITVHPGEDVEKVARLLLEHNISGLPVTDAEGRVLGVITEGDLVIREKEIKVPAYGEILGAVFYLQSPKKFFEELKRTIARSVEELMSKQIYTVGPEAAVSEISALMVKKSINRVPVVDKDKKLLGIVSRQDIIRAVQKG
ncbi:MAG: CBS domain-containing protein [Bacillota bacterium]|nr:CBS domain-containing protein [Bacillota bacterium]